MFFCLASWNHLSLSRGKFESRNLEWMMAALECLESTAPTRIFTSELEGRMERESDSRMNPMIEIVKRALQNVLQISLYQTFCYKYTNS